MRTFWLIVFLAAASCLNAAMNLTDAGYAATLSTSVTSAPASSCPTDAVFTNDTVATTATFGAVGRQFVGQSEYTNMPLAICKLAFRLYYNGSPTNQFKAMIVKNGGAHAYDMDITNGVMATSDYVTMGSMATTNWVTFTFSTPYTLTANQLYCLVCGPVVALAGNDINLFYGNNVIPGYRDYFNGTTGAADQASGTDMCIKIWWYSP